MKTLAIAILVLALISEILGYSLRPRSFSILRRTRNRMELYAQRDPRDNRRIVGKDNLGEPIYEGDEARGEKLDVLGFKLAIDPLSASLAVFILIAFQFFVVANL